MVAQKLARIPAGDPRRPAAGGRRGRVGYIQPEEEAAEGAPPTAAAGETDKYAGRFAK
jgi:hypothetical protein